MHHPTDRIAHTTAFVTSVVEHWLERETNRPDDPSHLEQTYHGATSRSLELKLIELNWEGINSWERLPVKRVVMLIMSLALIFKIAK